MRHTLIAPAPTGDVPRMKKPLSSLSPVRIFIISCATGSIISLMASPLTSTAQAPEASPVATDDARASISQPLVQPDTHTAARDAALRQAEDDLLKKLSASLPSSDGATSEPVTTIVVAEPAKPATAPAATGAVLSERVGAQAAPNSSTQPAEAAVAALSVCPPCALQASAKTSSQKRSSRSSGSAGKPSGRVSGTQSVRDEFTFHGRSGNCSESIDDPYVPTSKQARVIASRAQLRIGPGRSESSLFMMPKNAIVSIEFRNGQWYRVVTATGIRGWLSSSDIIFDVDVPDSSTVKVGAFNGAYEPTGITF